MVGRASRVWTVVKLILDANGKIELKGHKYREDGVHRVLKDVWLYEEARSETAIQDQILGNLNDDQKMKLKRHFLTFLADLEVKFNGNVRRTLRCPDGQWKPVDWCNHHYSHKTDGLSSSQRGRDNPQPREAEPTRISRKHTPANIIVLLRRKCVKAFISFVLSRRQLSAGETWSMVCCPVVSIVKEIP